MQSPPPLPCKSTQCRSSDDVLPNVSDVVVESVNDGITAVWIEILSNAANILDGIAAVWIEILSNAANIIDGIAAVWIDILWKNE